MFANREGTFNAYPLEIAVAETGENKLTTCIIKFGLSEEVKPGLDPVDCSSLGLEITHYFYIERKDGTLNVRTIDSLKAALGWDGTDVEWLQTTDLSQHPVQVKLGFEEYEGKTRLKVQYLNPYGSFAGGGVTKAGGEAMRAIRNRLGAKLRAISGGVPANPPKAAPAAPKPAPPKAPPAPKDLMRELIQTTMDDAWAAFLKTVPSGMSEELANTTWYGVLESARPGKATATFTSADWSAVIDKIIDKPKDAAEADELPADDIPF